jgi:hypothetical protein
MTFEKVLSEGVYGNVMIMDEDKFPKGYTAALALLRPHVKYFIRLGDRYQSQWHEPNSDCQLNDPSLLGEGDFYSQYSNEYLIGVWRYGIGIANFFRQPTFNKCGGGFHFTDVMPKTPEQLQDFFPFKGKDEIQEIYKEALWCVGSHNAKSWATELNSMSFDTFTGTQGKEAYLCVAELSNGVLTFSDPRILYTLFTRAKHVILVANFNRHGQYRASLEANPILGPLYRHEEFYRLGTPVRIRPEWSVDIMKLVGELPSKVKMLLSGPPEKLVNRDVVEHHYSHRCNFDKDFVDPDAPGKPIIFGGARLDNDFYAEAYTFKPYIDNVIEPPLRIEPVIEPEVKAAKLRTHLPQTDFDALMELNYSDHKHRFFDVELKVRGVFSDQKPDAFTLRKDSYAIEEKLVDIKMLTKQFISRRRARAAVSKELNAIEDKHQDPRYFIPNALTGGLRQNANDDPVSFAAGVAQRIRRGNLYLNKMEMRDETGYGLALWQALKRYLNWRSPIGFNQYQYNLAIQTFQERRADRSQALQKASLPRSEPEFSGMLTAKTQIKLKDEGFKPAKPLQTIFVTGDKYLFKMGPLGIYLLDKILENTPSYWFLYAKKQQSDFEQWIAGIPDETEWEMNDLVSQDTAMTGAYVVMFSELMRFFSIPQDLIDFYVESKLDFKTRTILMGIMTLSGEIFTYLINSVGSAARECLKFDMRPGERMANGGDDTCKPKAGVISETYKMWENSDRAEEKRYTSTQGEFCTFIIKKGFIYKNPRILFRRLQMHLEYGKLDDVLLGYFEHWIALYNMGDNLMTVMTPEHLEHVVALNKFFFNAKKLSKVAKSFNWAKVTQYEEREYSPAQESSFVKFFDVWLRSGDQTTITNQSIVEMVDSPRDFGEDY